VPNTPFIPLAQLASAADWHAKMQAGSAKPIYLQAEWVVTELVSQFGEPSVIHVFRDLENLGLNRALQKNLGIDTQGVETLVKKRLDASRSSVH